MCTVAFVGTGLCGLFLFGADLKADFLLNMSTRPGTISVLCRISYCLILICHIPYFFFMVKEYFLVMYDETLNQSLSKKLCARMNTSSQLLNQKEVGSDDGLTYKRLPDRVFFWSALSLQVIMLVLALTVSAIESVFGFVGAIGASSIMFFFPGIAYLTVLRK